MPVLVAPLAVSALQFGLTRFLNLMLKDLLGSATRVREMKKPPRTLNQGLVGQMLFDAGAVSVVNLLQRPNRQFTSQSVTVTNMMKLCGNMIKLCGNMIRMCGGRGYYAQPRPRAAMARI